METTIAFHRFSVFAFSLLFFFTMPVLGQDEIDQASETEEEMVIEEVTVQGVRQSLANALVIEQESGLVVEAISSENIGQLPDITIAEALVRLPGINGSRDRGNESQVAIRGMGPRLSLGLVNGREVASSEPNRNIRWEMYPSEIVNTVLVYKSQAADLIAGGVAGTVDLRTIAPLDYTGPAVLLRAGPTYYDASNDIPDYDGWGYRFSAAGVGKLSETFAASIAVSGQQQKNGYPSFQGWGYNDDRLGGSPGDINGDGTLDYTPWGAQTEIKKLDQDRIGLAAAFQWRPSGGFELSFDLAWTENSIEEDQDQTWLSRNGNWGNWGGGSNWAYADYEFVGNDIVAASVNWASVTNVIARYTEDKSTLATGLNAAWNWDAWTLALDGSYSKAERDNIWAAARTEAYPEWSTYDMRANILPIVTVSDDTADPNNQYAADWLSGIHDGPEYIDDELYALRADISREVGQDGLISAGLRISDREKNHSRNSWDQWTPAGGLQVPPDLLSSYDISAFEVPTILTGDYNALVDYLYGGWNDPGNSEQLEDRWIVDEDVTEFYAKWDFSGELFGWPMGGNLGARWVDVETKSSGYESVGGGPLNWITVPNSYSEVLPSASINFFPNDEYILRFGVAQVMARPPLDELRAGRYRDDPVSTPPPLTAWGGNPKLEPFLAWQVDVSSEWYFAPEALFAVALYYKDVDTHIGYSTVPIEIEGNVYALSGPHNGDGGTIKGVELTFQTPFSHSGVMQNFGIYSNYAYVDSNIEEFYPWFDPLPAAGIAENTATVDLWYSGEKFEARLGWTYHSEYTLIYGWDGSDVRTLRPESIFGLSMSYQFTDRFATRFQVNNLTDERLRIYRDNNPNRLGRYDEYGRYYLLDFSFTF